MFGCPCMLGCPLCLDAPVCLDTPICLDTPCVWMMCGCQLYIHNTKKGCFVRLRGCPYAPHTLGCPHMFGCPLYVWMAPCMFGCPHMFELLHMFGCPICLGFPFVWTPLCMVGCPPYVWLPPCMIGCCQMYGASKGIRDIQTYGGCPNIQEHPNIWGCPNIHGAFLHAFLSREVGLPLVQSSRGTLLYSRRSRRLPSTCKHGLQK